MKRLAWLSLVALCCVGCQQKSAETQPTGEAQQPAKDPAASDPPGMYLGKPLDYWTEQAARADRTEDTRRIVEALTRALEDERSNVRIAASDALGALGPAAEAAVAALVKQLDYPDASVRVAVMETFVAIGPASVPDLIGAFEHPDPVVGKRAGMSIRDIGQPAMAALEEAARSDVASVRDGAAEVIEQIKQDIERAASLPERAAAAEAIAGQRILTSAPDQWGQFQGPGRDSICTETGLLETWPEEGPELLWKLEGLGRGYSTVSIAHGIIFTMGGRELPGLPERQLVIALDLETRERLWATPVGLPYDDGPRCTPTVDGELLYALGTDGDLVCLETDTGEVHWRKNLVDDFGGQVMTKWKYAESPLIDGMKLVCTPGAQDAMIVALDKMTGQLLWKTEMPEIGDRGKDGAGYSSIAVAQIGGRRQYVQTVGRGVIGVDAETGRFLWGYNRIANETANIPSPRVQGDCVFVSTAYRTGSALLKITRDGDACRLEEVYFLDPREFENHHGGVVLVGDYVYGGDGTNKGAPVCLELATGRVAWKAKAPAAGSAAVLYADGYLIFRYDRGPVVLIEATPEEFRLKGRFTPITVEGPAWAHPVVHDGKLYLRHNDLLLCYDLSAGE